MSTTDLNTATRNANLIFEAAKRLKAAANRYSGKATREQEARDEVKALQAEAHAVTTAMVDGSDMSDMRDLAAIQKDLQKAHNKVDKAIEKGHDDKEEVADALAVLENTLAGNIPGSTPASDDQEEAA